jgi:hypothetical protein
VYSYVDFCSDSSDNIDINLSCDEFVLMLNRLLKEYKITRLSNENITIENNVEARSTATVLNEAIYESIELKSHLSNTDIAVTIKLLVCWLKAPLVYILKWVESRSRKITWPAKQTKL